MNDNRSVLRDKLLILAIFAALVAGGTGYRFLVAGGDGETTQTATTQPAVPSEMGEFRGVALQLHNSEPSHPFEQYIDEIAQTGANTLCLVVTAYQENCSSTSIFIEARKTPPQERMEAMIARAKGHGMRVVLMPIVLLENQRDGEWRGKILPAGGAGWDDWWQDYTNYVLYYAKLCQRSGVEVLMVGSELISTEKEEHEARWRELIAKVRKVYHGRLGYSANWDHYKPVRFWDDLDLVGMTTYYDLTGGKEASLENLMSSWTRIKADILEWQAKVNRPILFTEVGWPNQKTCAQYPWDYYRDRDNPDPVAQANCFEAFFRTWMEEDAMAGFLVWEWRNHPGQEVGPADPSYVPMGKPCMEVIEQYFRYAPPPRLAAQPQQEHAVE